MARQFGRILSSIWDDDDFLDLSPTQQRLYMFLVSQANLNHAGLLPLTFKRWASTAKGLTAGQITDDLVALENARFVVIDFDKEELLVRALVRRDDVWKAPRVMGAMVSNAMEIRSRKLRAALMAEIDRLPLDELKDEPAKDGGPSIRQQVDEHIAQLRRAYGPIQPPPQPPRSRPVERDTEGVGEPLPEPPDYPLPEEDAEGDAEGVYARARVPAAARVALSPSLALEGFTNPSPASGTLFDPPADAKQSADAAKPRGRRRTKADDPEIDARNQLAVKLARTWYEGCSKKPSGKFIGRQQIVYGLLEAGHDPDDIAEALRRCDFSMTRDSAEFQLKRMAEQAQRDANVVVPFQRNGRAYTPYRNPADQSVYLQGIS